MKKKKILIGLIVICVITVLYFVYRNVFNSSKLCTPNDSVVSIIETGDLVFSVGESTKSDVVRIFSHNECDYSHVGIVIKLDDDNFRIVHMSSDLGYIASQSLGDFIKTADSSELGFYRFKKQVDKTKIETAVDSLVKLNKEFDDDFNLIEDEKYYCTEFIYKLLRDIKSDIYYDIKCDRHLLPDDLISSEILYKVTDIK